LPDATGVLPLQAATGSMLIPPDRTNQTGYDWTPGSDSVVAALPDGIPGESS
jgi:hypothetical protein